MFQLLSKTLQKPHHKMALSHTLKYRLTSYKNENVIGGGLEKPQGGLKEEKYFSDKNNNLMLKIRDHGPKLKNESSEGNLNLSDFNGRSAALRDSCSINKQKNCLEEAFFLYEQSECCAKLSKLNSFEKAEIKQQTKTDNIE